MLVSIIVLILFWLGIMAVLVFFLNLSYKGLLGLIQEKKDLNKVCVATMEAMKEGLMRKQLESILKKEGF